MHFYLNSFFNVYYVSMIIRILHYTTSKGGKLPPFGVVYT